MAASSLVTRHVSLILVSLILVPLLLSVSANSTKESIVFSTVGRAHYAFDIFAVNLAFRNLSSRAEFRVTDGVSVHFNGHFPRCPEQFRDLDKFQDSDQDRIDVVYTTLANGKHEIFYDAVYWPPGIVSRFQAPLLKGLTGVSLKDRPSLVGDRLVYVSTHEDPGKPRASWAAVYSTELMTGSTRRLTPIGIADFSPAVSPSGNFTAVASYGEGGWTGEVEDLTTDIYVFHTRDGSQRVRTVEYGGWPSWVDDRSFFFHRRSEDGWISIFKATLPVHGPISTESVEIRRVTPPGVHAFTPAASPGNHRFIALATRRQNSNYRHVELYDLVTEEFTEVTRLISPDAHHYNPFLSPDAGRVGYHRCRGPSDGQQSPHLMLENLKSPDPQLSLFRIDGSYPSFSPGGDRIAYTGSPGLFVVDADGRNRREILPGTVFSTTWDPIRDGVVYTSLGPTFASEKTEVDIVAINVDSDSSDVKRLTTGGDNNAFPSVSPDGRWIVFRSGRSGHKNLYIINAEEGEEDGIERLTDGPWSDTMGDWSPDGELIVFASDRENPGSGSFGLYLIHPNGTGLRTLFKSGAGGRANHPKFNSGGKTIVFTSDFAGISAEPITNPHQFQPYGDIFSINLDGSNLQRLTHNSYEDGTPAWSSRYIEPFNVEFPNYESHCSFDDCHWLKKAIDGVENRIESPMERFYGKYKARCSGYGVEVESV